MSARTKKILRAQKTAKGAKSESLDRQIRGVMFRVNQEGLKALQLLAVERDAHIQQLGIEALNDLLLKYGKRPVVQNPLLDVEE